LRHEIYRGRSTAAASRPRQARRIEIDLKAAKPQLCLTIRDQGKGFSWDGKAPAGMGLRIMGYPSNKS